MRRTSLSLGLLLASATLSAQVLSAQAPSLLAAPGAPPAARPQPTLAPQRLGESPIVLFASPNGSGCPIGIVAERRAPAIVHSIESGPAKPQTQGIELRFSRLLTPEIAGVTLILHGHSGKGQLMPAGTFSSDLAETFQLRPAEQAQVLTASYLQPKRVRTAQWIELTSVDYADGSTWHPSYTAQCTVTPSYLVLVSAR